MTTPRNHMPVSRRRKRGPSPLFFRHAGVSIYHTTRDDEGEIVRQFWFGTDPAVRECEGDLAFDVRQLPGWAEARPVRDVLVEAVDAGLLPVQPAS